MLISPLKTPVFGRTILARDDTPKSLITALQAISKLPAFKQIFPQGSVIGVQPTDNADQCNVLLFTNAGHRLNTASASFSTTAQNLKSLKKLLFNYGRKTYKDQPPNCTPVVNYHSSFNKIA